MDLKIGDLLRDVTHFLSDSLEKEDLSSNANSERQDLLRKLSYFSESAQPYIDMSRSATKCSVQCEYVALNTNEVESKMYEEFPPPQKTDHLSQYSEPQEQCPQSFIEHLILPASKLRVVGRHFGTLWRKEKFMGLFVERSIRCYAGLLHDVLYVYNSEKDLKPAFYINLQGFDARPAATYHPTIRKKGCSFELVCPGKKSYQFMAFSVKDMEQWIACINEVNETREEDIPSMKRQLPSPPANRSEVEEYDDIKHGKNSEVEDKSKTNGADIYHNIKDLNLINEKSAVTSLYQISDSKTLPDCDLLYDDIGANPSLYYNMTEKREREGSFRCDKASKEAVCDDFGYNDDDIYDDIGILQKNDVCDVQYTGSVDKRNSQNFAQKKDSVLNNAKKNIFNQTTREETESVMKESVCIPFNDNLYEPVDNPRDE